MNNRIIVLNLTFENFIHEKKTYAKVWILLAHKVAYYWSKIFYFFFFHFLKLIRLKEELVPFSAQRPSFLLSFLESLKAIFWENKRKFCWISGRWKLIMPEMHYPNKQLTLLLYLQIYKPRRRRRSKTHYYKVISLNEGIQPAP